jgi:hypothetical protein
VVKEIAELQRFRGAGVRFALAVQTTPVCRLAVVADLDGNAVLIQRRKS